MSNELQEKVVDLLKAGVCPDANCDGKGTTFNVYPERCGHRNESGCCGDAVPAQEPAPCQWCHERDAVLASFENTRGPESVAEYTQGICQDGAAILRDGVPLTIEQILERLRERDELLAGHHSGGEMVVGSMLDEIADLLGGADFRTSEEFERAHKAIHRLTVQAAQLNSGEWVSVEDRLPETDTAVLVTDGSNYQVCSLDVHGDWVPTNVDVTYDMAGIELLFKPMFWKRLDTLPQPPEEK